FAVVMTGVQIAQLRHWLVPDDPPPAGAIWVGVALGGALLTRLLSVSPHWLRGVVGQLRRRERQLKATNDALTESREALSLVIAESPDAIIATGDRGVIQLVNDTAERLLGYAAN